MVRTGRFSPSLCDAAAKPRAEVTLRFRNYQPKDPALKVVGAHFLISFLNCPSIPAHPPTHPHPTSLSLTLRLYRLFKLTQCDLNKV